MFRRHGPAPALDLFAVSFNEDDKLRLIGAPEEMVPAIRQMLGPIIQSESKLIPLSKHNAITHFI